MPDPSDRCTMAMAWFGSLTLALSFWIAASFQVFTSEEDPGQGRPVEHAIARLQPLDVDDRHDAPITMGNWAEPLSPNPCPTRVDPWRRRSRFWP